jgi:hypothetical protein
MNIKAYYNNIRRVGSGICLSINNNILIDNRVKDSGIMLTIAITLIRSSASASASAMACLARLSYISTGGNNRGRATSNSRRRATSSSGENIWTRATGYRGRSSRFIFLFLFFLFLLIFVVGIKINGISNYTYKRGAITSGSSILRFPRA